MQRIFRFIAGNPKTVLAALVIAAVLGVRAWRELPVDVFPDVSVPRVTIMTAVDALPAPGAEIVSDGAYELKTAASAGKSAPAGHFHADGVFHEGEH